MTAPGPLTVLFWSYRSIYNKIFRNTVYKYTIFLNSTNLTKLLSSGENRSIVNIILNGIR